MTKKIIVINGSGGVGKDTFVENCAKYKHVYNISTVDKVKSIAIKCGWNGITKSSKDRKFLSDLKDLLTEYSDFSYKFVEEEIAWFYNFDSLEILFIHCREPKEIKRLCDDFGAKSLLITSTRIPMETGNHADRDVLNYDYDYHITNDGTLRELEDKAVEFLEIILGENNG